MAKDYSEAVQLFISAELDDDTRQDLVDLLQCQLELANLVDTPLGEFIHIPDDAATKPFLLALLAGFRDQGVGPSDDLKVAAATLAEGHYIVEPGCAAGCDHG